MAAGDYRRELQEFAIGNFPQKLRVPACASTIVQTAGAGKAERGPAEREAELMEDMPVAASLVPPPEETGRVVEAHVGPPPKPPALGCAALLARGQPYLPLVPGGRKGRPNKVARRAQRQRRKPKKPAAKGAAKVRAEPKPPAPVDPRQPRRSQRLRAQHKAAEAAAAGNPIPAGQALLMDIASDGDGDSGADFAPGKQ